MTVSGFEKFKHNPAGYRAVLKSDAVRADLQGRANAVKAAAQRQITDPDVYLIADTVIGRNRASATIIGVPLRLEKRHRILGRAIEAA